MAGQGRAANPSARKIPVGGNSRSHRCSRGADPRRPQRWAQGHTAVEATGDRSAGHHPGPRPSRTTPHSASGAPHLTSPRPPASNATTHSPPATRARGQGLSCVPMSQHEPPCHQKHLPPPHLSKSISLHRLWAELLGWAATTRGRHCPAHVPGMSGLLEGAASIPLACRAAGRRTLASQNPGTSRAPSHAQRTFWAQPAHLL